MKIDQQNFDALVEKAMKSNDVKEMRPVIVKELLHYDILYALDTANLLDGLTFQGGTSLRLCYGAHRYSEDLDFAVEPNFKTSDLLDIKGCLEQYLGGRYGLPVSVKEPKNILSSSKNEVKVNKWRISIVTSPKQKDMPHQKIKIDIATVPVYSSTPKTLVKNYNFLPDGYVDTIIMTESIDEIMADKLISLVNCQKVTRHRDIWDLRWLQQQGATIEPKYILAKIIDYQIEDYLENLEITLAKLETVIFSKAFSDEMKRFIPLDVRKRTVDKSKFYQLLLNENLSLLMKVREIVTSQ